MTEDEAKTKWCPFARVIATAAVGDFFEAVPGVHAHNRVQEPAAAEATWHAAHECIGSACMAWRDTDATLGAEVERISATGGSTRPSPEWIYRVRRPGSPADGGDWVRYAPGPSTGYCGLAGQP